VVEVYLSDGRIWYFQDYLDDRFENTVAFEDRSDPREQNSSVSEKDSADVDSPYLGDMGEYALSTMMPHGTVVSRDNIVTEDYEKNYDGLLQRILGRRSSELDNSRADNFEEAFRKKYRNMDDVNIAFVDQNAGLFNRNSMRPYSIFEGADLMVFAYTGRIDDSYEKMETVRDEVTSDLEKLADKLLEEY